MKTVDQLIHAKWILSGEKNAQTLENHALVIHQGLIQAILPSTQASEQCHANTVEHFSSHVLLPGLINTHTHLAMN